MSQAFSLNSDQLISIFKGFVIAEAGAVFTVAAAWVVSGSLDFHVFLLLEGAAISSTAVNFLRKYIPSQEA